MNKIRRFCSFLLIHGAKIDTPPLCRHWLGFARPCGSSFKAQRASAWRRNGITGTLGRCAQQTAEILVLIVRCVLHCRYHYCIDPERQLLVSSYTFLSSTLFSPRAVDAVFLIWAGSNYDKSPFMSKLESAIQYSLHQLPEQMPFLVLDRFAYIAKQSAGKSRRPSSMSSFQNVLGIIYSGYSVGCSGFAELYSLGDVQSQRVQSALDLMHPSQVCPYWLLPRSI